MAKDLTIPREFKRRVLRAFGRSDAIAARERAIKFVDYCRGLLRKRPR
jgi:hypothetical protein